MLVPLPPGCVSPRATVTPFPGDSWCLSRLLVLADELSADRTQCKHSLRVLSVLNVVMSSGYQYGQFL